MSNLSSESRTSPIPALPEIPLVECVVVAWRAKNLPLLIDSFRAQTVRCRITVITSGRMAHGEPVPEDVLARADRIFRTSQEFGAFNRYLPAFAYESEFVYFHDDDMLPGSRLIEHFLHWARELGRFGVLGQMGRRFRLGGYDAHGVKRTALPERVDVIIRGYFLPVVHLPFVLESMHLLGLKPGRDNLEDDLVLAWTMARKQLHCCLTPADDDPQTRMVSRELSTDDARSHRGDHYRIRDDFVRAHWALRWMVEFAPDDPSASP